MLTNKTFAITISRQLGAGGLYVGQQLAEKMNIFFADRVIIREAAKKLSTYEENLKTRDEKLLSFWSSFLKGNARNDVITIPSVASGLEFTDQDLFDVESDIIRKIAKENHAVILGRCGFHILRNHPHHLSIFLHADKNFRINRIKRLYNITDSEATKMIEKYDKERAAYCKSFTGKDWLDSQNYDLSINTEKIAPEKAVELILGYLKQDPIFNNY